MMTQTWRRQIEWLVLGAYSDEREVIDRWISEHYWLTLAILFVILVVLLVEPWLTR
jgi:hypothetical protein